MKRLRDKLHSESGASILLALLMFLLCVMAASTILASASSNAGKTLSNRVEHQKYLTLSSAIRLVADELERAEYKGRYKLYEWTETTTTTVSDETGNQTEETEEESYFYCEQIEGTYTCGDLTDLIPLRKELDAIFAEQFSVKGEGYKALETENPDEGPKTYTLTVTLPDDLPGYPYSGPEVYQVPKEVTVQAEMNHSDDDGQDTCKITLTAWLGTTGTPPTDESYTMTAELTAKNIPTLNNIIVNGAAAERPEWASSEESSEEEDSEEENPDETNPDETNPGEEGPSITDKKVTEGYADKAPTTWELNWIKKGAA